MSFEEAERLGNLTKNKDFSRSLSRKCGRNDKMNFSEVTMTYCNSCK